MLSHGVLKLSHRCKFGRKLAVVEYRIPTHPGMVIRYFPGGRRRAPERSVPFGPVLASLLAIGMVVGMPVTASATAHVVLSGVSTDPAGCVGDHRGDHSGDLNGKNPPCSYQDTPSGRVSYQWNKGGLVG